MKGIRKFLDKSLEFVGILILMVMIITVLYQIFTRTVLNNPNTVTEELVRFCMVWISLLASAYVVGKQQHLAVTLLSEKLNDRNRHILDLVIQVLFVLFSTIIMIYGGIKGVSITMNQISPSLSLPMGYVYLAVPVSGVIMLIYSVLNLIDCIFNKQSQEE
ncbi:MAG: TRAP transporter small permease [Lachnospiraceae bacterium]